MFSMEALALITLVTGFLAISCESHYERNHIIMAKIAMKISIATGLTNAWMIAADMGGYWWVFAPVLTVSLIVGMFFTKKSVFIHDHLSISAFFFIAYTVMLLGSMGCMFASPFV